jgi:hypothetical protein
VQQRTAGGVALAVFFSLRAGKRKQFFFEKKNQKTFLFTHFPQPLFPGTNHERAVAVEVDHGSEQGAISKGSQ